MATRTTSKQAARRRAKTTAVDDRSARPRRAKAPEAAPPSLAWRAGPPAPADVAPYPLVAVDVLWAAVASATIYRATPAAPLVAPNLISALEQGHDAVAVEPSAEPVHDAASVDASGELEPSRGAPTVEAKSERHPSRDVAAERQRQIALRAYAIAEASGFRMAPFDAWLYAERAIVASEIAAGLTRTSGAYRSA
ncbi:MAG: hypothetical protein MUF34_04935 [Polyangiaceae bacterium]|nr:hypothetical protein [Polyangiaceae bacterium]